MRFTAVFSFFFVVLTFCTGCSSSGSDYVFEQPAAFVTVGGTVCKNGRSSYMAFVIDNTKKYGARIRKISGCEQRIDKSLKDKRDDKRGIYVGGTGMSVDKIISGGEAIVAVASSGTVLSDHWKDDDDEAMRLEPHKGRIVLRKFDNEIKHVKEFNRSFVLDFYPEIIKNFNNEGFFFSGSDFAAYYIGFVDAEGNGSTAEIAFPVSEIAIVGGKIRLFDSTTGTVYTADSDLSVEEAAVLEDYKEGRMVEIQDGRLAFFKDNKLEIFDSELNSLNTLEIPEGFDISGVAAVYYGSGYRYRKFTDEIASEKINVYDKNLSDEEKDAVSDANISLSSSWETVEAENGNIVWIGTKNGYVRAYDFETSSWLVEPFDSTVGSTYELEMRPYLSANYLSFPKNSLTTSENAPFVEKVSVARGVPAQMTYKFVYEGLFDGSFTKGAYTVIRETFGKQVFAGTASETGSGDSGDSVSFEDDFISVVIRRADDSFVTEPETSFYITVNQGVPFVGFASADIMTDMENPSYLRFFGFSSLTRRFVEYNMYYDTVDEVYK